MVSQSGSSLDGHAIVLNFTGSSNEQTKVQCKCGENCGTVKTGTRLPEVMELYQHHIKEDE